MNRFFLLLVFVICLSHIPSFGKAHLLPDDLPTDDAEQLEREKRSGGFFDRIFKSFPWFKKNNEQETEEEEEDKNNNDRNEDPIVQDVLSDDDITASFPGTFTMPDDLTDKPFEENLFNFDRGTHTNTLEEPTPSDWQTSTNLTSIKPTPTLSLIESSHATIISPSISVNSPTFDTDTASSTITTGSQSTPAIVSATESTLILPFSISPTAPVSPATATEQMISDSIEPTSTSHISVPTATVAASVSASSYLKELIDITPSPSMVQAASGDGGAQLRRSHPKDTNLVEIILGSGPPHIADERGYGETVYSQAPHPEEEHEEKSMRVMMSSLFIPVMSGLFGALCVALVISIMKCVRRRKLKKIKYYGGKPESRLFGLDHMGLLSDMSSDEED